MTKDEALKMALETLEEINKLSIGENAICLPAEIDGAMEAIHQVLSEPKRDWVELKLGDDAHKPWCDSVTKLLLTMPPQIPLCNCKPTEAKLKEKNHD